MEKGKLFSFDARARSSMSTGVGSESEKVRPGGRGKGQGAARHTRMAPASILPVLFSFPLLLKVTGRVYPQADSTGRTVLRVITLRSCQFDKEIQKIYKALKCLYVNKSKKYPTHKFRRPLLAVYCQRKNMLHPR